MTDDDATGYESDFLPSRVELPRPLGDTEIHELRYPRFTVLLDPARRLAAVTAVNIDGGALRDLPRTGQWRLDPRVAESAQAGPELYAANSLDRGHLVRRRDPGWGTVEQARRAMAATFFYTNAAPQAGAFNQSKDLWLGLEDHVLAYAGATAQRISVFTAPVLAAEDPPYRGILIPRRFFKVAAWTSPDSSLRAAGFVLDQSELLELRDGEPVVPSLGAFRTFQTPIADIEHLAGIDLGDLVAADALTAEAARGEDAWRLLRVPEDVFLG
ncbi:DNA/RNA non-specific endonuclease [Microbacterium timonense]|uniref:DNA/RNA non-specific endonuclease n=1 Tax=Microbacterium timonense TaxID=2086576 RepID=UPI001F2D4A1B|nr:DNA/RNA non-specific endonuclease [Microbacterium timonense]